VTLDISDPVFGNPSVMTLQSISNRYQLDHAILKIDCEGCEYAVILSTPNNILDKFDYLLILVHQPQRPFLLKM
jgi:FkbM family methyltransferase